MAGCDRAEKVKNLHKVFVAYSEFMDGRRCLTWEGLLRAFDDGAGDFDFGFAGLGLKLDTPAASFPFSPSSFSAADVTSTASHMSARSSFSLADEQIEPQEPSKQEHADDHAWATSPSAHEIVSHDTRNRRLSLPDGLQLTQTVLKLDLPNDKARQKAIQAVMRFSGIRAIGMGKKMLIVTSRLGAVDPVHLVRKLQTLHPAELLYVGPPISADLVDLLFESRFAKAVLHGPRLDWATYGAREEDV